MMSLWQFTFLLFLPRHVGSLCLFVCFSYFTLLGIVNSYFGLKQTRNVWLCKPCGSNYWQPFTLKQNVFKSPVNHFKATADLLHVKLKRLALTSAQRYTIFQLIVMFFWPHLWCSGLMLLPSQQRFQAQYPAVSCVSQVRRLPGDYNYLRDRFPPRRLKTGIKDSEIFCFSFMVHHVVWKDWVCSFAS